MAQNVQSSVLQVSRWGAETTIGTQVAAYRRMASLESACWPEQKTTQHRSQGDLVDSVSVLDQDWGAFDFSGNGTYHELTYIFGGLLCKPVHNGAEWLFQPQVDKADVPQSYTIEHGEDDTCAVVTGAIIDAATFSWTRDDIKVTGSGFAMQYLDDQTPTANPSRVNNEPVAPNQVSLYIDSSYANLGTTLLTHCYSWDLAISKRWSPDWVMDQSLPSWKDVLVDLPTMSLKVKLMRDDASAAFLTQMRANKTRYLQVITGGATAGTYFALNVPFVVTKVGKPVSVAGAYAMDWEIKPVADSDFLTANNNGFMTVRIGNTLGFL